VSASIARFIARRVASRMLQASISAASAIPAPQARAFEMISS
jgi:hypothetical protein